MFFIMTHIREQVTFDAQQTADTDIKLQTYMG